METLSNRISIQIPDKELQLALQKLAEVSAMLEPYLIALTAEERRQIPKMSDGNAPFVEKALRYAKGQPDLAPAYLKIEEMDIDFKAVNDLAKIFQEVTRLGSALDDTIKLAGSEAWMAALAYYNSVKMGTKLNVPGAKPVYEDLRKRFGSSRTRPEQSDDASAS
jgi:hypothetical protein